MAAPHCLGAPMDWSLLWQKVTIAIVRLTPHLVALTERRPGMAFHFLIYSSLRPAIISAMINPSIRGMIRSMDRGGTGAIPGSMANMINHKIGRKAGTTTVLKIVLILRVSTCPI